MTDQDPAAAPDRPNGPVPEQYVTETKGAINFCPGHCLAKYGIATSHFYWIGAIPAMVFVGVFMMPFYYGSRARSVPEYLRLRFDEKTRALNAISFAVMTIFSSGISMYAMARLIQTLHLFDAPLAKTRSFSGWSFSRFDYRFSAGGAGLCFLRRAERRNL